METERPKKLGITQKSFLFLISQSEIKTNKQILKDSSVNSLLESGFIKLVEKTIQITELGKKVINDPINSISKVTDKRILTLLRLIPKTPTKWQMMFLLFADQQRTKLSRIRKAKRIIPQLIEKELLEEHDEYVILTPKGKSVVSYYHENSKKKYDIEEINRVFFSQKRVKLREKQRQQSDEFLKLYSEGLTYQAIGDLHGISRERVRQILVKNPNWENYLKEEEEKKKLEEAEEKRKKKRKKEKKLFENNLATKFPKRVAELWDYEKNGELKPEEVQSNSTIQKIWWRCPKDSYSWEKSPYDISYHSWSRFKSSGCPKCAGKTGKSRKRSVLTEKYFEYVIEYWDFDKNEKLGSDPEKITIGSNKKAWFKCPKDGNEWKASIAATVNQQWSKGNAGCGVCNGTHTRKKTAWGEANKIIEEFPIEIEKYWNYEKNDELGIDPTETKIGSAKRAWFKCPIDNYEWDAQISVISSGSWKKGNSGCPQCGMGWTTDAIRQFVKSLEKHISNLTQSERYKIFEQAGILKTNNSESLQFVKDIIKGKLSGQKLNESLKRKKSNGTENIEVNIDELNSEKDLKVIDIDTHEKTLESQNKTSLQEVEEEKDKDLPKIRVQKSLDFLNSKVVASSDQEAIDFFVASRQDRIWAEVFEDESAVEGLVSFTDDGYGRKVRDEFLDEYNQASEIQIPRGWSFRIEGNITPPNLMQKVTAVRLRNQKRMLNLSLTGTGKTIGGILSSRIIGANLTVIICPLDTIKNWHSEIKHVFPDSLVTIKNFDPYWINIENGNHYIILNHEMFQQPKTAQNVRRLIEKFKIDLVIVDEIHRCKQRTKQSSKRREMVLALITNATKTNPNLHVLGMSATPIINNLKEGISLVELVSGLERNDLGERATLNNCMKLHQAFVTLGIRSRVKPKIKINRERIPIDCTHLVDEIREEGKSVLKMEQILTKARIPTILSEIKPKTIIYTHYVEGIVDQLQEAIEEAGWSVGFHIGGDKSGREQFINGSTDVLIASSAMAVGVDGLQKISNRLILNIPPWTSAELEQLEGRINRQGQIHKELTIIFPVTYGSDEGEYWSWDEGRLQRLQNKQTIADAAVDGVMPEGKLRTEAQAFKDLRKWLDRLKTGEQKTITRTEIFVPLPETDVTEVNRRLARYGDFSRMNARWNTSYSSTTYDRLKKSPEEWMQYHTFYQEARKTWEVIPYEESIKWLEQREGLKVGDFGCGEAIIAKTLSDTHTVYSFDYISIDENVTECDISKVPIAESELDIAIFNLSLMGLNSDDYLKEAFRVLKLDGQLWIYENESHIKNVDEFIRNIELIGFKIIENNLNWKFRYIRAIKS